jgi:flagellar basal-body rod protein FlgC
MYGALDTSTSGLVAQRTRFDIFSANVANSRTILNADGEYEPYRRRFPLLAQGDELNANAAGVHVASIEIDDGPLRMEYEPGSPYADADGYVGYPNIDPVVEQMNAMVAFRAYEANIAAVEATKSMLSAALQMLA